MITGYRGGVRLTHLPTGISAQVDAHRSNHRNEVEACGLLRARLALHRMHAGPHPMAGETVRVYELTEDADLVEDRVTGWREKFSDVVLSGWAWDSTRSGPGLDRLIRVRIELGWPY